MLFEALYYLANSWKDSLIASMAFVLCLIMRKSKRIKYVIIKGNEMQSIKQLS
jgi:hypothetical protein